MKKTLLLLLCLFLIFSCEEKKGESSQEKSYNTETSNSRIEEDNEGRFFLRNTSKNEKFQFTISVFLNNCNNRESLLKKHPLEIQELITLNPGQQKEIGTSCNYTEWFDEPVLGFLSNQYNCKPCNDTSKITYSVMGEYLVIQ